MALKYDLQFYNKKVKNIVGVDEAGRGCLLGPVYAAAVILTKDFSCDLINDSKKLTEKQREKAFSIITKNALSYGIAYIDAPEIDRINILEASKKAMEIAISKIDVEYDLILTDFVKLKNQKCEVIDIAHGDALSQSIAAASILAKVSRDNWCKKIDKKYPEYNIAKNKGYGTKDHLIALKKYGPIKKIHRMSYKPVKELTIEKISLF